MKQKIRDMEERKKLMCSLWGIMQWRKCSFLNEEAKFKSQLHNPPVTQTWADYLSSFYKANKAQDG